MPGVGGGLSQVKLGQFFHFLAIQPGQDGDIGNRLFLARRHEIAKRDVDITFARDPVGSAVRGGERRPIQIPGKFTKQRLTLKLGRARSIERFVVQGVTNER